MQNEVEAHWRSLGLSYQRRGAMGLALQKLPVHVDAQAREEHWDQAH